MVICPNEMDTAYLDNLDEYINDEGRIVSSATVGGGAGGAVGSKELLARVILYCTRLCVGNGLGCKNI